MLRDWLELIRVPNVFTAMADVAMGFFFVMPAAAEFDGSDALTLGLLIAASSLLYSAGMALNDVCDYEEDCRERPERPLPSGRITRRAAAWLGVGLLIAGLLFAAIASVMVVSPAPALAAGCLACAVVLYDLLLKHSWFGPVALGACRALNVALGMSAFEASRDAAGLHVAGAVGLFVVGFSVMARGETRRGTRAAVLLGAVLMTAAVGSLAWLPEWRPILAQTTPWRWMVVFLALLVAWRCSRALVDPSPAAVQRAVGQSIRSLVVLDALIIFAVAGLAPSVAVLLLLVPNIVLGRWFYST
ncbi:MAG TPA: UbiA family prenyltransferase [Thermoguttaceae bacterium]|nr:UbiA family prenyltransferase [Thermoguttaceae bacterium]